jgi:hypothetical protein
MNEPNHVSAMLYDLTIIDRASSGASDKKSPAAGVEFAVLQELHVGPAANVRSRSFAAMLSRIVAAFDPPLPLTVSTRQHVLIAEVGHDSVGLSIIEPEGEVGFDMLTWVDPPWRHLSIAVALKYLAVQNARRAGISAMWAPVDTRSTALSMTLGIGPAEGFTS